MDEKIIEAAATQVADARQAAAAAAEALADAEGGAARIRGRIAEIEAQRASIVNAARSAGVTDAEAALRLECLTADARDLAPLLRDAEAELQKAKVGRDAAQAAVTRADQAMQVAIDAEKEKALLEHATHLDALLLETVLEIEALRKKRRARPVWSPTDALMNTLIPLQLTRQRRAAAGLI